MVVAPICEKWIFSSSELLTVLSRFIFIVRVFLFQLDDCKERASLRDVKVGVDDGGGTGVMTIVAVTVFDP